MKTSFKLQRSSRFEHCTPECCRSEADTHSLNSRPRSVWNEAKITALHAKYQRPSSALLSFLVVHAVVRLPMSVLLVFCEPQLGRRLEVGTAQRSELLFELWLVREQDTSDRDQVKVFWNAWIWSES